MHVRVTLWWVFVIILASYWSSMLIRKHMIGGRVGEACWNLLKLELHSFSSQKHIRPFPPPSDMHTWSTMNRLISKSSVQPRRIFISAVLIPWTIFTQHPSHNFRSGIVVQLNGSKHFGSSWLLHSKHFILVPDMHSATPLAYPIHMTKITRHNWNRYLE